MKLPEFDYHAPGSVDEVLALLAEHGDEAKILAGGQSLVPLMAMRLLRPTQLIDVNRLAELSGIEQRRGEIAFGAIVRQRTAERSAVVGGQLPLLAEALPFVAHPAIRTRGTIGGSIAHADPSAEVPGVLVALDGSVTVRSLRAQRTIAAEEFFRARCASAIDDDECLVEVRFPIGDPEAGFAFREVARRHGDLALVGVAAMISLNPQGRIADSRIVLIGVGETPLRIRAAEAALIGAEPAAETFAEVAEIAAADLRPPGSVHGSAAYLRHLAAVTVRRALATAAERAGPGLPR